MAGPQRFDVVDHDERWSAWFDEIRVAMEAVLDGIDATVEHVGSTAVPGLAAKPIVDVDVVLESAGDVAETLDRLETIGYVRKGDRGIEGREMLRPPEHLPYHHPYVVVRGNKAHLDHVLLRDLLRRDPEARQAYEAEKRKHAHLLEFGQGQYTDAKSDFVAQLLVRARDEAGLPQPVGELHDGISYRWREPVDPQLIDALVAAAFDDPSRAGWWSRVRSYSLGWVTAHDGEDVVGFVNITTDGGRHAFLLDLVVAGPARGRGVGTNLVRRAIERARAADCEWLHVDFTDDLTPLYVDRLGFDRTAAGLVHLID